MADAADRHVLYQKSVQAPETEIDFFLKTYKKLRKKKPLILREDFCGTALLSVTWCQTHKQRQALGVDLCQETLDWARMHNLKPAGTEVASRVSLINANVLEVNKPKSDITCATNFSYSVFNTRDALRNYFKRVRKGLKKDGLFIADMFGGTETFDTLEEEREIDGGAFTYIWEQEYFNPITHHIICHIHFAFPDGSRLERAFTYEWRLWTIPELSELLQEAGFNKVRIFWEEYQDDGDKNNEYLEGTGNFIEVSEVENQESWVSYIVAET